MRKISAFIVATAMLTACAYYNWLIWRGVIEPALMTWIIFCVAVSSSLWTYWSSENCSLVNNIANTVDSVIVWITLMSIILFGRELRLGFNSLDIFCLISSAVIMIFWRISKLHDFSYLALQGIMTIAYFPTLYRLWNASKNTESFSVWVIVWLTSAGALIPAIMGRDKLAIVYASRAFVLITALIGLMIRLELR